MHEQFFNEIVIVQMTCLQIFNFQPLMLEQILKYWTEEKVIKFHACIRGILFNSSITSHSRLVWFKIFISPFSLYIMFIQKIKISYFGTCGHLSIKWNVVQIVLCCTVLITCNGGYILCFFFYFIPEEDLSQNMYIVKKNF